jgi:hypothetical protein
VARLLGIPSQEEYTNVQADRAGLRSDARGERREMYRVTGFIVVLALIAAVGTAVSAQSSGIVPGQGIGRFQLGQDLAPVLTALGPLHSEDDLPGGAFRGYYWPLKRIGVIINMQTRKVAALAISYDDSLQTEKGVMAGTEMDAIRSAYGKEESVDSHQEDDTLVYDKLGVAFVVDKSGALGGRVSVIFVFGQGRYNDIFQNQK